MISFSRLATNRDKHQSEDQMMLYTFNSYRHSVKIRNSRNVSEALSLPKTGKKKFWSLLWRLIRLSATVTDVQSVTVFWIGVVGVPQPCPGSRGPNTASLIPDLPLSSWQGQTSPIRENQASSFAGESTQVVHGEGQGLHNELENVSYNTTHFPAPGTRVIFTLFPAQAQSEGPP